MAGLLRTRNKTHRDTKTLQPQLKHRGCVFWIKVDLDMFWKLVSLHMYCRHFLSCTGNTEYTVFLQPRVSNVSPLHEVLFQNLLKMAQICAASKSNAYLMFESNYCNFIFIKNVACNVFVKKVERN